VQRDNRQEHHDNAGYGKPRTQIHFTPSVQTSPKTKEHTLRLTALLIEKTITA
jgi:hypothetical protein